MRRLSALSGGALCAGRASELSRGSFLRCASGSNAQASSAEYGSCKFGWIPESERASERAKTNVRWSGRLRSDQTTNLVPPSFRPRFVRGTQFPPRERRWVRLFSTKSKQLYVPEGHDEMAAIMEEALRLKNTGRFKEALERYDEAIARDRNNVMAHAMKADIFFRKRQYAEAIECHEEVSPRFWNSPCLIFIAVSHVKVLRVNPKHVMTFVEMALCQLALKEHQRALNLLNDAIFLDSKVQQQSQEYCLLKL